MGKLDQVTTGIVKSPDLMLIYGPEGVGKSTFASKAPKAIFLDIEKGSGKIANVNRYDQAKTYLEVTEFLHELMTVKHDYKTLVIDSTSELERMIWKHGCLQNNWISVEDPGYGKGYVIMLQYWENILAGLVKLQSMGMNIILIGHADVKTFTDPTNNASYDRYQLKVDKKANALLRERLDFIGFANFVTYVKGKESAMKQKAFADGTRKLFTERRPAWDAKNRLGLPLEIPFEYDVYAAAANAEPADKAKIIRSSIEELLKETQDEELKKKVLETVAKAADNTSDLSLILERLRTKFEEEKNNGLQQLT